MEGGPVGLILKGCHPITIPAKFDLVWFRWYKKRIFKCEKVYDLQTNVTRVLAKDHIGEVS
jgi:hypothetical protein